MSTVLVVDDSPLDRRVAGACVEEAGATPIYAKDGSEALSLLEEHGSEDAPDVVLTDLQMPNVDGLQLVRRLRTEFPTVPAILMTAWGSEATAAAALREGAASYIPKKELKQELGIVLRTVLHSAKTARARRGVVALLERCQADYVLGYDMTERCALVSLLQEQLLQFDICDHPDVIRVGTALSEAFTNAVDHGNLELDSALRTEDGGYRELGDERQEQSPFADRRVQIHVEFTQQFASFTVTDEGPGFDPSSLPDPKDPENLMRPHGRGVMLIHTFMDHVNFNEEGNSITMKRLRRRN